MREGYEMVGGRGLGWGGVNLLYVLCLCMCKRERDSEILKAGAKKKRQRGISWSVNLRGLRDGAKIEETRVNSWLTAL